MKIPTLWIPFLDHTYMYMEGDKNGIFDFSS